MGWDLDKKKKKSSFSGMLLLLGVNVGYRSEERKRLNYKLVLTFYICYLFYSQGFQWKAEREKNQVKLGERKAEIFIFAMHVIFIIDFDGPAQEMMMAIAIFSEEENHYFEKLKYSLTTIKMKLKSIKSHFLSHKTY